MENRDEILGKLNTIFHLNGHAQTAINPRRLFIESFYAYRLMKKNRWGEQAAASMLSSATMLFYTGILFKFGKKLMDFALSHIDEEYAFGWINGKFAISMYIYFAGRRFNDLEEEKVLNRSIQVGEYWKLATFYIYNGYSAIEAGNEKLVLHYLQRLEDVGEIFDNKFPEVQ